MTMSRVTKTIRRCSVMGVHNVLEITSECSIVSFLYDILRHYVKYTVLFLAP